MKHLFTDDMYTNRSGIVYDRYNYEYKAFAVSVDLREPGWRGELEREATKKFEKLKQKDKRWRPYRVVRDGEVQSSYAASETMDSPLCVFKKQKASSRPTTRGQK